MRLMDSEPDGDCMIGLAAQNANLRRCDVTGPSLVFGGLLLTAFVVCNGVDLSSSNAPALEEAEVARGELAAGPEEADLIGADCESAMSLKSKSKRFSKEHCSTLSSSWRARL
jgi:hypothetical protein